MVLKSFNFFCETNLATKVLERNINDLRLEQVVNLCTSCQCEINPMICNVVKKCAFCI